MGLYRGAAVVRALALAALTASTWLLRHHPPALLGAFFACYAVFSFGAGFGGVAFMEVVGRTVPSRRLGAYFAQRLFWGGLLGAGAALAVRKTLELPDEGLRYAVLFGLATAFVSAGYTLFGSIQEPEMPASRSAGSPLALLGEGWEMLRRDPVFRHLLIARAAFATWFTASPFVMLFAVHDLGAGARTGGTFLLARLSGFVLSNLLWHPLSRRHGNRAVLRAGTLGCCMLTLAAAAISLASPARLGWIPARAAVLALEGVMALGGAPHSAILVGYASLAIELAPAGRRQSFVSTMNSFLGPTMLMPAAGGALLDVIGAPALFALCGVVGFVGFRAARLLPASREEGPTRAGRPGW